MFNKVLVPLNPYDLKTSTGILPYIASVSRDLSMRVMLVSVIDPEKLDLPDFPQEERYEDTEHRMPPGSEGILLGTGSSTSMTVPGEEEARTHVHDDVSAPNTVQIIENVRFESNRRLNRIAMRLREEGIETKFMTSIAGETSEEILRLAEESEYDLIALATHDRSLLGQAIKGSVTNEVIRDARVPIMAILPAKSDVIPEERARLTSILVPLDGSPFAETVLPYVEHLARGLHLDANLVRVVEVGKVTPAAGGMTMTAGPATGRVLDSLEDEASEYLQRLGGELQGKDVNVRWQVLEGTIPASITRLADEEPGTLIALASHGRGGLNRVVFGSMAEQLLRDTGDPLLIIPSRLAEQAVGVIKDRVE
jgi:nucleotide-binding universal stress UspA family protein